ncbi:hypothetical protein CBL_08105 [Carabus blaptoides fortunei]
MQVDTGYHEYNKDVSKVIHPWFDNQKNHQVIYNVNVPLVVVLMILVREIAGFSLSYASGYDLYPEGNTTGLSLSHQCCASKCRRWLIVKELMAARESMAGLQCNNMLCIVSLFRTTVLDQSTLNRR